MRTLYRITVFKSYGSHLIFRLVRSGDVVAAEQTLQMIDIKITLLLRLVLSIIL